MNGPGGISMCELIGRQEATIVRLEREIEGLRQALADNCPCNFCYMGGSHPLVLDCQGCSDKERWAKALAKHAEEEPPCPSTPE